MRPRVFPAEDSGFSRKLDAQGAFWGFNEAAGIPRGRPRTHPGQTWGRLSDGRASMRPRVFPAEDVAKVQGCASCTRSRSRFNEAAGIPRGRLPSASLSAFATLVRLRFNEAAGIPRGRLLQTPEGGPGALMLRFNEAAGIPRGRLLGGVPVAMPVDGSGGLQ